MHPLKAAQPPWCVCGRRRLSFVPDWTRACVHNISRLVLGGAVSLAVSCVGAIVADWVLVLGGMPPRPDLEQHDAGHRTAATIETTTTTTPQTPPSRTRSLLRVDALFRAPRARVWAYVAVGGALGAAVLVSVGAPTGTCKMAACYADPEWCYDPEAERSYDRNDGSKYDALFDQYCFALLDAATSLDGGGCFYDYATGHGTPSGRHWCRARGVQSCGHLWGSPLEAAFNEQDRTRYREWPGFETRVECTDFYLPKVLALKVPLISIACGLLVVRVAAGFAARRAPRLGGSPRLRQLTELARVDATEYRLLDDAQGGLERQPAPGALDGGVC